MLRTFHRYQKYLTFFVLIAAIALAMSGFGFHWLDGNKPKSAAIVINDQEISYNEFHQELRSLEQRYRSMFGKNFDQLVQQANLNLNQQVIDRKISEALTEREARKLKLYVSTPEWKQALEREIFPEGYSADRYRAILQQLGMTQEAFEQKFREGAIRSQFMALLHDASAPSLSEVKALNTKQETKYSAQVVAIDPAQYESKVKAPTDEEVQKYYEEHESNYQVAPRVSYQYIVLKPSDFLDKVQVQQDEVELLYTENLEKYSNPEAVKVRHVQLNFPQEKDTAKMASVKEKAQEVLEKAKRGESFDSLALQYSDDVSTKTLGGDLGWVSRGKMAKEFDAAAFKVEGEGVADLVATDYGYHVVKVEAKRASEPKKLEEVKPEIEKEIRLREAPTYAADQARELYDSWTKTKGDFGELAKSHNFTVLSSSGLLFAESDPDPSLTGLTKNVLDYGEDERSVLVELPNVSVLVSVTDRKDVQISPLAEVREKIITALKTKAAKELAKTAANEALAKLQKGEIADLAALAKAVGSTVTEEKEITLTKPGSGIFSDREVNQALVATVKEGEKPSKVFDVKNKYYLFSVASIVKPAELTDAKKLAELKEKQWSDNTETLVQAIINRGKVESVIDVSPSVMGRV